MYIHIDMFNVFYLIYCYSKHTNNKRIYCFTLNQHPPYETKDRVNQIADDA